LSSYLLEEGAGFGSGEMRERYEGVFGRVLEAQQHAAGRRDGRHHPEAGHAVDGRRQVRVHLPDCVLGGGGEELRPQLRRARLRTKRVERQQVGQRHDAAADAAAAGGDVRGGFAQQ